MTSVRTNGEVEFRFFRATAKEVAVCGDFTGWQTKAIPMRHEGKGWWRLSKRVWSESGRAVPVPCQSAQRDAIMDPMKGPAVDCHDPGFGFSIRWIDAGSIKMRVVKQTMGRRFRPFRRGVVFASLDRVAEKPLLGAVDAKRAIVVQ